MPIYPPTDADRCRLVADLRRRVQLVCRDGWEPYEWVWSTGEVTVVRAVLGDQGAEDAAVEVWAPILWGVAEAEADAARDFSHTRPVVPPGRASIVAALRVYVAAGDPLVVAAVRERIAEAETVSARTCEECGRPGRMRTDRPWVATLCDEHAAQAVTETEKGEQ